MRKALLCAMILGLAFAFPATAQAPSVDQRLSELEDAVSSLAADVEELQRTIGVNCIAWGMAISKRPDNTLTLTRSDRQTKVYVALMRRACIRSGNRDRYGWPGYVKP